MAEYTPKQYAVKLLSVIRNDRSRLERIDRYHNGHHEDPYLPRTASDEYKLLAKRAVTNWCPILVSVPAQALYVDNFRRSTDDGLDGAREKLSVEWQHWQYSRLDARQGEVYRDALKYGHAFIAARRNRQGKLQTRTLPTLSTAALYEDPANDIDPLAVLSIRRVPSVVDGAEVQGRATLWTEDRIYEFSYPSEGDFTVGSGEPHGFSACPVTRFHPYLDSMGRTMGVIEPMIPLQNRLNQTVFDLLVAQTYGSFKVRWATGMAPPMKMTRNEQGVWIPEVDAEGNPVPDQVELNASRMMFGEDSDVKFGTLDETPLGGFIQSVETSIQHLAALSQTPPHHLLGQMANLSADALRAAETGMTRKVTEFQYTFGESWERHLRLVAEAEGDAAAAKDFDSEVMWRDMGAGSIGQTVDALQKLHAMGVPTAPLVEEYPGMTEAKAKRWRRAIEEANVEKQFMTGLSAGFGSSNTSAERSANGDTGTGGSEAGF